MPRMTGADRRRQILEAAIDIILERGVATAATRDVTRAIGVGTGLLHHYFSSWPALRAEAVALAAKSEIAELGTLLEGLPAPEALERIADWMVEDEDMRHWRLWLNALDEAHRDDLLADVMNAAMRDWHRLIADLLTRAGTEKASAAPDPEAAAWRIAALMDGLAGAMLVRNSVVDAGMARDLIAAQLRLESGVSPAAA